MSEDSDVAFAARVARVTDTALVDPIVGLLVPGAGDLITTAVGLLIVAVAVRKKLPPIVIARMLVNLGIDAAVGAVPIVGDVFDFVFRANSRNLALLRARYPSRSARPSDWAVVAGAALLLLAALALPVAVLVFVLRSVF